MTALVHFHRSIPRDELESRIAKARRALWWFIELDPHNMPEPEEIATKAIEIQDKILQGIVAVNPGRKPPR